MNHGTPMNRLSAARQRVVESRQRGHPGALVGRPALHRVGRGADFEVVGLPNGIRRRGAGNEARADTALPGVRWRVAARTVAHGFRPVTGLSEPNAIGTPWDASSANGFNLVPRSRPRRCTYLPSSPPHSAQKFGCTLANTPHDPSRAA